MLRSTFNVAGSEFANAKRFQPDGNVESISPKWAMAASQGVTLERDSAPALDTGSTPTAF